MPCFWLAETTKTTTIIVVVEATIIIIIIIIEKQKELFECLSRGFVVSYGLRMKQKTAREQETFAELSRAIIMI